MIAPQQLFEALVSRGIGFFTGVPDSLLKSFCAYVDDHGGSVGHVIAANEGNAVAMALGFHLATGRYAAVYMQNSGLGNAVNPLTSLADPEVYRVPMLLIIGWRGEPGVHDEPQHVKQGRISREQLDLLEVPYWILHADSDVTPTLDAALSKMVESNAPVALLVRKDAFANYKGGRKAEKRSSLGREQALRQLLDLAGDDLVVSTTGKTSREVFELRARANGAQRDFLTVGGMGHTSSIALGVALGNPERRVVCLDGDGSALMHLGAMAIIGDLKPKNLVHVLLNNAAHESVGGQPTVAGRMDFEAIARACGYSSYLRAADEAGVADAWTRLRALPGPALLEIDISVGSRDDLGRPTSTPEENKLAFMRAAR
ncbi:phosphonopyruvate decarboxylase [Arenimonas sp.]|uniref:phosphonopyruvate decarboxylase n=1 Tax=Arenimonas sp. TaxID=1872635 RepID=UPI0039E72649